MVENPPILILDEATSALDATTEMKVQAALDELMKERTTFVIAHRHVHRAQRHAHSGVRPGRIVETGSFDELIHRGGASPRWPRRSSWSPTRLKQRRRRRRTRDGAGADRSACYRRAAAE